MLKHPDTAAIERRMEALLDYCTELENALRGLIKFAEGGWTPQRGDDPYGVERIAAARALINE